jgi:hypothetical protein
MARVGPVLHPSAVRALIKNWLDFAKSGQDARVSHCDLSVLEDYMRKLCLATHRNYDCRPFRSKQALASEIGDIFRSSL